MGEWVDVRDGGKLLHLPAFLPPGEADSLLARLLTDVPWKQEKSLFGKPAPRLNAWFSDAGLEYRYSGLTHRGNGWRHGLHDVRDRVSEASGTAFNSLLLNRYRDGNDSMGMHADNEPELGDDPAVATLSLGAERNLVLRHRASREKCVVRLTHGSLFVMAGTSQTHWLHGVPKMPGVAGERVSLTFRRIVGASRRTPVGNA